MPANSSDRAANDLKVLKAAATAADVPWTGRVLMLGLNFIPLTCALVIIFLLLFPYAKLPGRIGIAAACLYLFPPLAARFVLFVSPVREGRIQLGTRPFFSWWTSFQLQVIFCRLPALEELLRLVPGLYSQWLRLWGAHIGRFTYWSAGTLVTDRSFLAIGNDVVFGAGVRLNAHVLAKGKDGRMELLLAKVTVGDSAIVGGYSLLTAGTEISAGEATRAFLVSPPFSVWRNGKRIRTVESTEFE